MGIEQRTGPIYFYPVKSKQYRDNYDDIFRKKDKKQNSKEKKKK